MRRRSQSPRGFQHRRSSSIKGSTCSQIEAEEWISDGASAPLILHKYPQLSTRQISHTDDFRLSIAEPTEKISVHAIPQQELVKVEAEQHLVSPSPRHLHLDDNGRELQERTKWSEPAGTLVEPLDRTEEHSNNQIIKRSSPRTGNDLCSDNPQLIKDAVRLNGRNVAATRYHISQCREELNHMTSEHERFTNLVAMLLQQIEVHAQDIQQLPVNRIANLKQEISTALVRVSAAQLSLESVGHDLKTTGDDLKLSNEYLKDLVVPDDSSEHPEILDRAFESASLLAGPTTIISEASSEHLGEIIDLNELLAGGIASSSEYSEEDDSEAAEAHDQAIRHTKALEMELEVRLLGIQFQRSEHMSPPRISNHEVNINPDEMQHAKRVVDIEERERINFYEDFWHVYRTSWLDFSRFLYHIENLAEVNAEKFGLLLYLSPVEIDEFLTQIEKHDRTRTSSKAADYALMLAKPKLMPLLSSNEPNRYQFSTAGRLQSSLSNRVAHSYDGERNLSKPWVAPDRSLPDLHSPRRAETLTFQHFDSTLLRSMDEILNANTTKAQLPYHPAWSYAGSHGYRRPISEKSHYRSRMSGDAAQSLDLW